MSLFRKTQPLARSALFGVLAVVLVVAASGLGALATFPHLEPWYASLRKPSFVPPNALFGPVWTALYALMAFAFWRILRLPRETPGRSAAIAAFLAQLALNALWSFLFFTAQNPLLGLLDIVPQWALIALTIALFLPLDRLAALCLVPLALWVGFATALNFAIWRMN